MAERRIEVVISAADDYSAAMRKFNTALGDMDGAVAKSGRETDKLKRALGDLSSVNDWAAGGVKKLKNIFEGFAFGGALGLVSGGISAFTTMLIEAYQQSGMATEKLSSLNGELIQQATSWKQLTPAIGGTTAAVVEYYNARLRLAQFEGIQRKSEILEEISHHEQLQKNYEINAKAFPQRTELTRKALEHREAIAKLRMELTSLNTVEGLTELSVNKVQKALENASLKTPELKAPEGGGSLMAFVMGGLDMPELSEKVGFTGLELGKAFATSFAAGRRETENTPFTISGLDYNQKYVTMLENDRVYNEAYFAILDERYAREEAYEQGLLDMNLTFSEQRFAAEMAHEQQIMNMKFAAGNQSIALMQIVGQKSKALQMAALVAQKALAIAQVWIQTQVASSAALAPPPLGLGPVFGAPLAASVQLWGKIQMGLIAATGLAEAAMGGAGRAPSGVGGGGGVGALPIPAPNVAPEQKGTQYITVNLTALDPSTVDMDRIVEDNIAPALERLSGENGRNVILDIQVKGR